MTVHLVKLCAGAQSIDDLRDRVERSVAVNRKTGLGAVHDHVTRMHPRRGKELCDGGSIYWVIKGVIQIRQKILKIGEKIGKDGIRRTQIILDPRLIETKPQPRRAFQGWRYLAAEDAPGDLRQRGPHSPPPELSRKLAELGLL